MDKAKIIAQTSITAEKLRDPEFLIKYVRAGLPIEDYYAIRDLALLGLESVPPEVARSGETPRTDALVGTFYLRCDDCPQAGKCERMKSVHPDDARQLERDFNDAMSGAAKLYEKLKQAQSVPSPLARREGEAPCTEYCSKISCKMAGKCLRLDKQSPPQRERSDG